MVLKRRSLVQVDFFSIYVQTNKSEAGKMSLRYWLGKS